MMELTLRQTYQCGQLHRFYWISRAAAWKLHVMLKTAQLPVSNRATSEFQCCFKLNPLADTVNMGAVHTISQHTASHPQRQIFSQRWENLKFQKHNKQEDGSFYQHTGLGIEKEASEVLHSEHSFIWCWNLDASGSRSETPGKFWNVVMEEDG